VEILVNDLSSHIKHSLEALAHITWRHALSLHPLYLTTLVNSNSNSNSNTQTQRPPNNNDHDAQEESGNHVRTLLDLLFGILGTVSERGGSLKGLFVGEGGLPSELMYQMVYVGISFAQVTDGQVNSL
jgi:hypothetical protein